MKGGRENNDICNKLKLIKFFTSRPTQQKRINKVLQD